MASTAVTYKRSYNPAPTVEQIQSDIITQLSGQYWAPFSNVPRLPFNPKIIEDIYIKELVRTQFSTKRIMLLEFSQYLENYLWPNYSKNATKAHVMSIIAIVNEKYRERVPVWDCFQSKEEEFHDFFYQAMDISVDDSVAFPELCVIITFFIHACNSLGNDLIRKHVIKLCSLLMWHNILPSKREQICTQFPAYKKAWKKLNKVHDGLSEDLKIVANKEVNFFASHIRKFLSVLGSIKSEGPVETSRVSYCERFLEWLIDVEAQLSTRRFFTVLLNSFHVVVRCRMSELVKREAEGHLFRHLLDMLQFYCGFEIDDQLGEALTDRDMMNNHYSKISSLQRLVFKNFPELKKMSLMNVASIDTRESLIKYFNPLPNKRLHELAACLTLVTQPDDSKPDEFKSEFLIETLVYQLQRRQSQLDMLNEMPLYPTETVIWNENVVPMEYVGGSDSRQADSGGLALPKLNLQFLTIHDYLLRNFNLFRLESTYEIRQDIEDAIFRMKPWLGNDGNCCFGGWARMAHPIAGFSVVEVAKPNVGENHPARVRADITVNLKLKLHIKREWEALRKHDVTFLITVRPHNPIGARFDYKEPFLPQVGLVYVRGCEIEGMLDESGKIIEEGVDPKPVMTGDNRTFRVFLDPNQYQQDINNINKGDEDPYETFNVIVRRKPKENNFKAVLETIRDLMNTQCVVPAWLVDVILGYGDSAAAHYTKMPNNIATLDWNDTFLDLDHLKSCFPDHRIILQKPINDIGEEEKDDGDTKAEQKMIDEYEANAIPPFKLTFCKTDQSSDSILVDPYVHINRGPYLFNQPKRNQVPFTSTQVEAIRAGMQPGLTMVVGPPGTGKTDVAVQIISNIYHNFPNQRTLIVTHSNQALNQLFEKIMCLDVEERHLLRLGHGEEELETDKDYSRYGRVNFVLAQRLELLEHVKKLQVSLDIPLQQEHTCETAGYFYLQVLAKYEQFKSKLSARRNKEGKEKSCVENVSKYFPFHKFFDDSPQPLFKSKSFEDDVDIAEGCFRYIKKIFSQLEEFRPFELLRNGKDRVRYLLIKEAKIIAMTCTHAALKRRDLVEAGFQYDNILMEESAQILEIETFIPLLLQNPDHGYNRLKRWIMIGDHHQLPPVIKNMAFQKFSNMEQSLFTRFVRIGIPAVELDAQGRSRPSICKLYNWRYKNLGNLPHLTALPEYKKANPGFFFDYQLIDVQDFNGVGESEPNPYFYQNLAEAECICAVYTYMRLVGYPADKISILTTYNGQKHLIRDVIQQRCANNKLLGKPLKITTVDRYQGQQNDIILLSLVRTKNVGHLRDVRRLVVAMSRARLGMYIFARVSLFRNCFELMPTFSQLMLRPLQLYLLPSETYKTFRPIEEPPKGSPLIINDMTHMTYFVHDFYKVKVESYLMGHQEQEKQAHQPSSSPQELPKLESLTLQTTIPSSTRDVHKSDETNQSESSEDEEEGGGGDDNDVREGGDNDAREGDDNDVMEGDDNDAREGDDNDVREGDGENKENNDNVKDGDDGSAGQVQRSEETGEPCEKRQKTDIDDDNN